MEREIDIRVVINYDPNKSNDFDVTFVQVDHQPVKVDHDGGIDRVWTIKDGGTGHSYLMLKWRPPLSDDDSNDSDKIEWEGLGDRWEAVIDGETVVVTLQSREVGRGSWQPRWVWEGVTLSGANEYFESSNAARLAAESTYLNLPAWRWVDVSNLERGATVRDMSPGAGYEGTVKEVRGMSDSNNNMVKMMATIIWHKWENEDIEDVKFTGTKIEAFF